MMSSIDVESKEILLEMRDLLKQIDQKVLHLIELNRFDRCISPKDEND